MSAVKLCARCGHHVDAHAGTRCTHGVLTSGPCLCFGFEEIGRSAGAYAVGLLDAADELRHVTDLVQAREALQLRAQGIIRRGRL